MSEGRLALRADRAQSPPSDEERPRPPPRTARPARDGSSPGRQVDQRELRAAGHVPHQQRVLSPLVDPEAAQAGIRRSATISMGPGRPSGPSRMRPKARRSRPLSLDSHTVRPSGESRPSKLPGPSCGVSTVSERASRSTSKQIIASSAHQPLDQEPRPSRETSSAPFIPWPDIGRRPQRRGLRGQDVHVGHRGLAPVARDHQRPPGVIPAHEPVGLLPPGVRRSAAEPSGRMRQTCWFIPPPGATCTASQSPLGAPRHRGDRVVEAGHQLRPPPLRRHDPRLARAGHVGEEGHPLSIGREARGGRGTNPHQRAHVALERLRGAAGVAAARTRARRKPIRELRARTGFCRTVGSGNRSSQSEWRVPVSARRHPARSGTGGRSGQRRGAGAAHPRRRACLVGVLLHPGREHLA